MKACYVLLECHLNEILKIFPLRFLKFDRVSLQIWSDIWKVKSASFLNQYQASQLKVNLVKVEVWQPFKVFNHFNLQDIFKTICYWRELCSSWKRENVGNNVIQQIFNNVRFSCRNMGNGHNHKNIKAIFDQYWDFDADDKINIFEIVADCLIGSDNNCSNGDEVQSGRRKRGRGWII